MTRFIRGCVVAFLAGGLLCVAQVAPARAGTPDQHPRSLAICRPIKDMFGLGDPTWVDVTPATGRKYRGGKSVLVYYEFQFSSTGLAACHFIIRGNKVLHGPHVRFDEPPPPA